jgi:putative flippase GtrA
MASALSRLTTATARRLPGPVRRKLQGETGKRFVRFVLVAVAAVISSQTALVVFLDGAHMTAGISGGLAAVAGAAVSYVLSRWAWERKGRPQLLRETLPFWLVSAGVWVFLGIATKLGIEAAELLQVHGFEKAIVIGGVYFAANCITFVARFLIFHFLLFADRGSKVDALAMVEGDLAEGDLAEGDLAEGDLAEGDLPDLVHAAEPADPAQVARGMSPARANGTSSWATAPGTARRRRMPG